MSAHSTNTYIICAGCGRALKEGEPLFEVARINFYCTYCCLPGVAGDCPIVGDQVLIPTEAGFDARPC